MKKPILRWPKIRWSLRLGKDAEFILTGSTMALGCELTCQQMVTRAELETLIFTLSEVRHLFMSRIRRLFSNYIDREVA